MANASHVKKKPNKQHAAKGASFNRIAKRLREQAQFFRNNSADQHNINFGVAIALEVVVEALEREGKFVSHLR